MQLLASDYTSIEYKVLKVEHVAALEAAVVAHLKDDWALVGGVAVRNHFGVIVFYQAMKKMVL